MSVNQIENEVNVFDSFKESAADRMGEKAVDRVLNFILSKLKKIYHGEQVKFGKAFNLYLDNAMLRYNHVRTLATGHTPRTIVGDDNIYVSVGVQYEDKEISTDSVNSLLKISNNILIQGTGGIGKSMLMRYLFLDTAYHGDYVPVLLELRRIGKQESGKISIIDLIYSCMQDFDVQLPRDQFEYSLRIGKYLFLMDGFDEVKESIAAETIEAIQLFCSKYPQNPCIITSRRRNDTTKLETFTEVQSKPLSLEQAVELSSKIWKKDEKTQEFCRQLETDLYKKHKDFAENPLLLSMMFLTFMNNNSVPSHLSEFYSKAFDAIYSAHDNHDKGYYIREFKCKDLCESEFKLLFSHFCFQTYFKELYEFSKEQIIEFVSKSIVKQDFKQINPIDFLKDLCDVVCILIEDGDVYRFAHRSFQAYFAALYTSRNLTDEQQRTLFNHTLSNGSLWFNNSDYYDILLQTESQRFTENALENQLRSIQNMINKSSEPELELAKLKYSSISIFGDKRQIVCEIGNTNEKRLIFNVIDLFEKYYSQFESKIHRSAHEKEIEQAFICVNKAFENNLLGESHCVNINSLNLFPIEEQKTIKRAMVKIALVDQIRTAINNWLNKLDARRATLSTSNFIEDL